MLFTVPPKSLTPCQSDVQTREGRGALNGTGQMIQELLLPLICHTPVHTPKDTLCQYSRNIPTFSQRHKQFCICPWLWFLDHGVPLGSGTLVFVHGFNAERGRGRVHENIFNHIFTSLIPSFSTTLAEFLTIHNFMFICGRP